jgi:colicin import membrane protein
MTDTATTEAPVSDNGFKAPDELRSHDYKHQAMADWLYEQTGYRCDVQSIKLAFAYRVAWRRTQIYRDLVAGHAEVAEREKAAEKEVKAKEKAEKAEQREKERAEKEAAKAKEKADKEAAAKAAAEAKAKADAGTTENAKPAKAAKKAATTEQPAGENAFE